MLYLLHGDDIATSRNRLIQLKKLFTGSEQRVLDGKSLDETTLTQAVSSHSLFGNETLVIIENLFGRLGKKVKLIDKLAKILVTESANSEIILWEDREIGLTVSKSLGAKAKIEVYKLPVVLWQFLDTLTPKKTKYLLNLYEKAVTTNAPELLFALLVKRIRQLIMLNGGIKPVDLQSWQAARLTTQAQNFTIEQLELAHANLLHLEYRLKSGNTPFGMSELIEQWLIELK